MRKAIYWSTADFELRAETNFEFLKEYYSDEYKTFDSWEQLYDKTKFPKMLKKMIKNHDATVGITWETIDFYLGKTEIKY
jgi:hypothetical protein